MSTSQKAALIAAAKAAFKNAYAPYSNFHVGAAALAKSGKIFNGCNMENASYGLTNCAERNCLGQAIVTGEREFETLIIYTEQEQLTPPCGACRQVIAEFLEQDAYVSVYNHLGDEVSWQVKDILPNAFTPKNLTK
ncbi:cytidine deaminase [Thalassotalea aquiviva]|uniref:cytidine deaminase n=1 Tax=Thalassotalea aquiviva TaxID=3242415 RepID=UPI003529F921